MAISPFLSSPAGPTCLVSYPPLSPVHGPSLEACGIFPTSSPSINCCSLQLFLRTAARVLFDKEINHPLPKTHQYFHCSQLNTSLYLCPAPASSSSVTLFPPVLVALEYFHFLGGIKLPPGPLDMLLLLLQMLDSFLFCNQQQPIHLIKMSTLREDQINLFNLFV